MRHYETVRWVVTAMRTGQVVNGRLFDTQARFILRPAKP